MSDIAAPVDMQAGPMPTNWLYSLIQLKQEPAPWPVIQRIAFRYVVSYFLIYILPFPLMLVPSYYMLYAKLDQPWQKFVLYLSDKAYSYVFVLPKPIPVGPNGSGDTTFDYLAALTTLLLALLIGTIWNIFSIFSSTKAYPRLLYFFQVIARYYLATTMLGYGMAKVIPMQFPVPGLGRLVQAYGDSSPMGILWTFMGASPPYVIFSGSMEVLGAILMLFRRTMTLGAIVLAGVLINVVALNFCYDVPVKLFSSHLLVLCIILILPQWRRLLNVHLLNRPCPASDLCLPVSSKVTKWTLFGFKMLLVLWLLYQQAMGVQFSLQQYAAFQEKPSLYGLYEVTESRVDGVPQPLLITDKTLYKRVIFAEFKSCALVHMNEERNRFGVEIDDAAGTITATPRMKPNEKYTLEFHKEPGDILILKGTLDQEEIDLTLHKLPIDQQFLLRSRGFHWINEFPYNR